MLVFVSTCIVPLPAFADDARILIPPGAAISQSTSAEGEIHFPPGLWDVALLVWLAAKIGPPGG
ncbi:MAG TPA: hypothetical protein VGQ46_20240 [Thermoanaerobaculia bacterium]|nr:hypothetical protein [Thermoanaerobaculia bacterium]